MNQTKIKILSLFLCLYICVACEKYLDVELDKSQVLSTTVFSDDQNVISALNGVYQSFLEGTYGGGSGGIATLTGLSSDELNNVVKTKSLVRFQSNALQADDIILEAMWTDSYKIIYRANDILDGLTQSTGVSDTIKSQVQGEALFMRAFVYFYLENLFGDVPLVLTTDYRVTSITPRTSSEEVRIQIINDLNAAIDLLGVGYIRSNRVRPNKATAQAFLARVLLYEGKWQEAEHAASEVISMDIYKMEIDLDRVFLKQSKEVIWQLASEAGYNSKEGSAFIIANGIGSNTNALTDAVTSDFEANDQRLTKWTGNWTDTEAGLRLDYVYKYKAQYSGPTTEFFVVLRLAEMYLIRAEARAKIGDLEGAVSDVDVIRTRAGLLPIDSAFGEVDEELFFDILFKERRIELLAEWGHRWFDLKRTERADMVLAEIKVDWSSDDLLYPIPQSEFLRNPLLGDQNDGY